MLIELSVITSFQDFIKHAKSWECFRLQQADNNVCNSWDWYSTWAEVFWREEDDLYIHLWFYQKEIIGIMPCYLKNTCAGSELRFIATGENKKSEVCSEFQDFLLHPTFRTKILAQFSHEVLEDKRIQAIIFDNILVTSIAYEWLDTLRSKRWIKSVASTGIRYIMPVEQGQSTQLAAFKSKSTRRQAKKFLADSHWNVSVVDDAIGLDNFYRQLIKRHNHSWNARNKIGAFEAANFVKFHRGFSEKLLKREKLIAFQLLYQSEVSALFYGMIDGDTLYYYQSAINHESQLPSAGVAMHVIALSIAKNKGLAFYDLMKGSNTSYKKRLVQSDIKVVNFSLCTLKYKVLHSLVRLFHKLISKVGKVVNSYD